MSAARPYMVVAFLFGTLCGAPSSQAAEVLGGVEHAFEQALATFDKAQAIRGDDPDRAAQLFLQAAQRLESIAATGIVNGKLAYNIGNCYLQAGDVGRAILYYRRAEKLLPGDALLGENLKTARSRCLTQIPADRASRFLHGLFFWHFDTSRGMRAKAAIVCYVLLWGLLALRCFVRRRWVVGSATVCAVLSLMLGASLLFSVISERNTPSGVLIAMDVPVLKGPGAGYQRQFEQPLQPGTEFVVVEQRGEWWKIVLPDGQSGWIERAFAQRVEIGPGSAT